MTHARIQRLLSMAFTAMILVVVAGLGVGCLDSSPTGPTAKKTEPGESVPVTVIVTDDYGDPIVGANVYTVPPTETFDTDETGMVVLSCPTNVTYYFNVKPLKYKVVTQVVEIAAPLDEPVTFVFPNEVPEVIIVFPYNLAYMSYNNVVFRGEGTDREDGTLPEDSLVWTSNVDGVLGTGRELVLDTITPGSHTITFEGNDIHGVKSSQSIVINTFEYDSTSFFPHPTGSVWNYAHEPDIFEVINSQGLIESWSLEDIEVEIEENNIRRSTMRYSVNVQGKPSKAYDYTVTDEISDIGNSITVSKTTEELKVLEGLRSNSLYLESEYTPPYRLIENILDPQSTVGGDQDIHVVVSWYNKSQSPPLLEFTESHRVDFSVSIGPLETIYAGMGAFSGVPITIYQGDSRRTWWLAEGVGIVKLSYDTFGVNSEATLDWTNMASSKLVGKTAMAAATGIQSARPMMLDLPAESGPDRTRAVLRLLRAVSPVAPLTQ
jgi:hypothetical protein